MHAVERAGDSLVELNDDLVRVAHKGIRRADGRGRDEPSVRDAGAFHDRKVHMRSHAVVEHDGQMAEMEVVIADLPRVHTRADGFVALVRRAVLHQPRARQRPVERIIHGRAGEHAHVLRLAELCDSDRNNARVAHEREAGKAHAHILADERRGVLRRHDARSQFFRYIFHVYVLLYAHHSIAMSCAPSTMHTRANGYVAA